MCSVLTTFHAHVYYIFQFCILFIALQFDLQIVTPIFNNGRKVENVKNQLSLCNYINTTSVHIAFLNLVDQIIELLQQQDYHQLLTQCGEIKASKTNGLNLFSNKNLVQYHNVISLMRYLSYHFTWCDHSILRMLCTCSEDATKLLDEFDSKLDCMQSVASYPIPQFSCDMLPTDPTSTHTVLAIRCDQELYNCTLQYVYDIRSLMVEKCDITLHCLQLLAVRPDPTILFWTIPQCVVELISSKVLVHSDYLYTRGVLEVLVYPEPLLGTSDDVRIGSLAFVAVHEDCDNLVCVLLLYVCAL